MRALPIRSAGSSSSFGPFRRKPKLRPERRRLALESLEPRTMLAATSAWLNGGAYLSTDRTSQPLPTTNSGYTVEAWVNRVDTNRCEAVVASGYNPLLISNGFWFGICNGGVPYLHSNVGFGSAHGGNTTVPANVWTHVAVTWSPVEERIYINGELDAVSASGVAPNRNQSTFYVGAQYAELPVQSGGGPTQQFWGNISEARVWNIVRTQDEIRRSMHQLLEGQPSGLLADWHLNGDTSDSAHQLPTTNVNVCNCGPTAPPVWRVTEVDANFNKLPAPRFIGASASIPSTNLAYLFGGYNTGLTVQSQILSMDMSTGDTTVVGNLPFSVGSQTAVYAPTNGQVYVFGGEIQNVPQNAIVKFDPATNVATQLAATLPTSLYFGTAAWHPGIERIVLIGGYNGGALTSIFLFDPATETVSQAAVSLPAGRYAAAVAYSPLTDRVYILGGNGNAAFNTPTRDTFELAINADGSGSVAAMPGAGLPLAHLFATAVEDPKTHLIQVLGGTAEYVQTFDPRTGKSWRTTIRMPRNYSGNANGAVLNTPYQTVVYSSLNRHALVIGGGNYGGSPTNKVWRVPLGDGPAVPIERWDFINSVPTIGSQITEIDGDDRGVYFAGPNGGDQILGINENGATFLYDPPGFNGSVNDIAFNPATGLYAGYSGGGAWRFFNGTTQQFTPAALGATNVYSVQPDFPYFGTDRGLKSPSILGGWDTTLHPNAFDYVWAQTGRGNETWAVVRNQPPVSGGGAGPWRLGHVKIDFFGTTTIAEFPSVCGDDVLIRNFGLTRYNDITQDQSGNLWIVGWGQGSESVCLLPKATLSGTPSGGLATSLLGNRAEAVDVDADNRVWVALRASNGASGGLTVYQLNNGGALRNTDYNWLNAPVGSRQTYSGGPALAWNSTIVAVAGVDERVYAAKEAGGVVTVAQRWQQIDDVLANTVVNGVWTVAGRTFFASSGLLTALEPDGVTFTARNLVNELGVGGAARVVAGDGAGRIWVGTNVGPRLYAPTGFDDLSDRAGVRPSGNVYAIVEEPDANPSDGQAAAVWIGGDDGLTLFDRNRFVTTFTTANSGLPAGAVKTLLVDNAGNLWAGTTAGLARLSADRTTWTNFTTANGLPNNSIFDLAQLGDGRIAISTAGGLSLYDAATFAAQTPPVTAVNLPLSVDDLGRLWAGSALLTVAGWRGYWPTNSGLKYPTIADTATDGADRIWFSHAPNPGVSVRGTFLPSLKDFTPIITGYSPTSGSAGTTMTINGFSLGSDPSEVAITVGGSPVDIVSVSETQVQVKLRDATTSGAVSLTRGGKRTTATTPFCAVPQIRAGVPVVPTGGNVGVQVDIYGRNFDPDATISIGGGPALRASATTPTNIKRIVEASDATGQIVVANHCAGATVSAGNFRKIDLAIPAVVFNQGMPSSGIVEDKATLIQNYVSAAGAPTSNEKVEIDEVREYITDRNGFVRRIDVPLSTSGVTPPLIAGATPSDAERLTIASSYNVPNMFFTESGTNTVRTVLMRRGRIVAETTTTVTATPNQVLQVLLVPFMRPDSTPMDLQTMKANIDNDLAQVRERIFPFGTANVVWADDVLYRSDTFSLDNFLNLYRAAPDMDRVRRRYNNNPNKPDAQIAMGVIQPSLMGGTTPGFAFGADVSQLLNTIILDDLDSLCDTVNGVVKTLSFGLFGSDDGCHLDIPLYVGWMTGNATSGDTLAHEIGHQLGLVKPWAGNGSLDDNLSHSINDELPADMECNGWDGVSFDWNKSFYTQPGVTRPIVDPINGVEFLPLNDNNPMNAMRAKAMMSYACGTTSANSFFEPIDVAQMNSQLVPLVSNMIGIAKQLLQFGDSPAASASAVSSPVAKPAAVANPVAAPSRVANAPAAPPDTSGPRMHVFGTLDSAAGTGELVRVESYGDDGPLTPSFATGYWLLQLDENGNELARTGVAPFGSSEQNPGGPAGDPTQFIFSATLRRRTGAARLELRYLDAVLDTFTAGDAVPVVQFVQPLGGEVFQAGPITVGWTATDDDGDPLEVSIDYSRDDGVTWTSIGSATGGGALDAAIERLAGTNGLGRFRVTASDGLHTGSAVSEAFSVVNQPPQVSIDAGMDGAILLEGKPVALIGTAYDAEDGPLGGANLSWVSSRDGDLGRGAALTTANLSVGFHAITLFATDSDGASNLATIYFTIGGDYDFDGIDDADEATSLLNPLSPLDAMSDADGDGLTLLVERQIGSNPTSIDSDGDGRPDDQELVDGTNSMAFDDPPAADALSTTASSISLTIDLAANTPLPQFTLGVNSAHAADWQLIADVDWLEATATTGTTPDATLIRVQAFKLTDGVHLAHLRFDSTTVGNSVIVPVTVTVTNRATYFDVDVDGSASDADCQTVQASIGLSFGDPGYDLRFDVDRDGTIEAEDVGDCSIAVGSTTRGDFDLDNDVDADDVDLLFAAIASGAHDTFYDLTADGLVTFDDAADLVRNVLGTEFGDANLDGRVDRADASIVGRNFGYAGGPAWARGDFDGDGQVALLDVATLQANMNFAAPASPSAPPMIAVAASAVVVARQAEMRAGTPSAMRSPRIAARGVGDAIAAVDRAIVSRREATTPLSRELSRQLSVARPRRASRPTTTDAVFADEENVQSRVRRG
ncbi:MAG: LamG-like jellyroll fold domain-containing protein [Pirellulales bacterium]